MSSATQSPLAAPEPDVFEILLSFAGVRCPECGDLAEDPICPKCGKRLPARREPDAISKARHAAISPLATRAEELLSGHDLPAGTIPISLDQFATCIDDLHLFDLVAEMPALGHELEQLDLNDPQVAGSKARRVVASHLEKVGALLHASTELARFSPDEDLARELSRLALDAGRWGAEFTLALIRAVSAASPIEARPAQIAAQELLSPWPFSERLQDLMPKVRQWAQPDVDRRISLALGKDGTYSDELGILDPQSVLGAFEGEEEPLRALEERATWYFQHLLPTDPQGGDGGRSMLVLPAVTMASLDRPLLAHRLSRQVIELMERAWERDPDEARTAAQRAVDRGPVLLAAANRVQQGFRLLAAGQDSGLADEAAALREVMSAYLEISESAFRTLGRLALDLDAIDQGGPGLVGDQPPTVGGLEQRLRASSGVAAHSLGAVSDSGLRNAAAHAQYSWEEETSELVDLETGERWSIDQLEQRVDSLVGAVVGADAGYACFLLGRDIDLMPAGGVGPVGLQITAALCFSPYGYRVADVADGGATVIIESPDDVDPSRLAPPLAGLALHVPDATALQVLDSRDREVLLRIDVAALAEARDAPDVVKDLAIMVPIFSAGEHRGLGASEMLLELSPVLVKVAAITALRSLAEGLNPIGVAAGQERLRYVAEFISSRLDEGNPELDGLLAELSRAADAVGAIPNGGQSGVRSAVDRIQGLFDWAESRGVEWPPF